MDHLTHIQKSFSNGSIPTLATPTTQLQAPAPVKGVYYFRFSGIDDHANKWMGFFLYKNDQSAKYRMGLVIRICPLQ